ncbi:hypothetical protein [Microbulbifer epialgicus]|uniref:Uncharacterized protein n=1 Tax=Microbulbifer epialgicus TaxID=393907 RepID=A0ABV4NZI8_9GAMM
MYRITLIFILLFSSVPLAQEDLDTKKEPVPQIAQKKTDGKKNKNNKSNSDDYKASEEISEDLSVSYPVDI